MKFGKVINYTITIEPTANVGFYVRVGCGRFAFANKDDLISALNNYLADPEIFEKEYNACEVFQEVPSEAVPEEAPEEARVGRTPR